LSFDYFYQHLPWNFITEFHEGVVIQKDGILQRTFVYRAPDIDSSGSAEINNLAIRVNDFAKRLGSGWAFQLEAQRFMLQEYPRSHFDALAPFLIDKERETAFHSAGRHFDSSYYLTFIYKPPSENIKKAISLFIKSDNSKEEGKSVKQNVEFFVNESNSVAGLLANNLLLQPLNNSETIAYLHSTISFKRTTEVTELLFYKPLPPTKEKSLKLLITAQALKNKTLYKLKRKLRLMKRLWGILLLASWSGILF